MMRIYEQQEKEDGEKEKKFFKIKWEFLKCKIKVKNSGEDFVIARFIKTRIFVNFQGRTSV